MSETTAAAQSSTPSKETAPPVSNGQGGGGGTGEPEDDDSEYEIEYVYEDEEEEEVEGELPDSSVPSAVNANEPGDVAYEVDEGEEPVPVYGEDEEEEEVEIEEEIEVDDDDEEFDRIADKIDALINKTTSLQAEIKATPAPTLTATATPVAANAEVATTTASTQPTPITAAVVQNAETKQVPTPAAAVEVVPNKPNKEPSPPLAAEQRASTMEETAVGLAPPGQLRRLNNQWNISDLHDEHSIAAQDNELNSHSPEPTSNLESIAEDEVNQRQQQQHDEVRALDRFARSLGDAMQHEAQGEDEEEEINEIEIALEDWNDDQLIEEVEEDELVEEEDDNDETDDQMPDNLLLHANDQIEAIDLPLVLTPSPTPSTASNGSPWPTVRRPISPSSLILTRMRQLVIEGQSGAFEVLVDQTPNFFIDAILKAGWTALMYASYRGYPDIVDFCLKRGADPNYHKEYFTSLMAVGSSSASNEGQLLLCVDLLLEQGARVDAVDKFGCTPLHYAARFGRPLLTKCLIEQGANINHTNRNGWSALHWAAAENHGQVVATLLDKNIDVHLLTRDGVTASQLAEIRKNEEIADALKEIEQSEKLMEQQQQTPQQPTRPATTTATTEAPVEVITAPVVAMEATPVFSAPAVKLEESLKNPSKEPEPIEEPVQVSPPYERQFSDAELEARKDEAREIVISAIDAALARDLSRLMGGAVPIADLMSGEPVTPGPAGIRKRTLVLGELDEDDEHVSSLAQINKLQIETEQQPSSAVQNIIFSLVVASVIFILLKLLFHF